MEIGSAVAGAFATVAVAGLVFTAVAVSNAQEPAPVVDVPSVAVVGHYSTVESVDPIEYVAPEPVVTPTVIPEVVVTAVPKPAAPVAAPAPALVNQQPAPVGEASAPVGPGPAPEVAPAIPLPNPTPWDN